MKAKQQEGGPRHAVILSGGGAYAAYEVGVMKALFSGASTSTGRRPLDPATLTGTSAGAFNAAALLSLSEDSIEQGIEKLERVWLENIAQQSGECRNGLFRERLGLGDWLNPLCAWRHPVSSAENTLRDLTQLSVDWIERASEVLSDSSEPLSRKSLAFFDLSAFLDFSPFEGVVRDTLKPAVIRNSPRALRIATTRWDTGELCIFGNGDMGDDRASALVRASAAIPGVFPPVLLEGAVYVDGGVLMNTPLQPAIAAKADVLHVIYLDPDVKLIDTNRINNIFGVFDRILLLSRADLVDRDIALATRVNAGITLLESLSKTEAKRHERAFQSRSGERFRRVSIHRYHPTEDLGGFIGLLDVRREHIERSIQKGVDETTRHDCVAAGCVTEETDWGAKSSASS